MREIKFRAWDENKREMIKHEDINYHYAIDCHNGVFKDEEFPMELMQYTGLKDKNGTEIYEGDIVKINYHNDIFNEDYTEIREIIFYEKEFCWSFYKSEGLQTFFRMINYQKMFIEIIGNIYENPELLNTN